MLKPFSHWSLVFVLVQVMLPVGFCAVSAALPPLLAE